jgi:hypothetical protein
VTDELRDITLEVGFAPWRKVQHQEGDELVINTIAGAHQVHCVIGAATLVYPLDPNAPPVCLWVGLRDPFVGMADFPELFA